MGKDAAQPDNANSQITAPALAPTDKRQGTRLSPSITFVIILAMFVSTAASMAGGLVMYFESLKSLEETVKETSAGEVDGLEQSVMANLNGVTAAAVQLKEFFANPEITVGGDEEGWNNISRALGFAFVKQTKHEQYTLGYVLIPYEPTDPSAVYSAVWADPLFDGTSEFVHASYNPKRQAKDFVVNHTATPPFVDTFNIRTDILDFHNASYLRFGYYWNAQSYLNSFLGKWDPRDGGLPSNGLWKEGVDGAAASRWRDPSGWWSSDGYAYTYGSYDTVFAPPQAPHPWSKYKAVVLISQFMYAGWSDMIMKYKASRPDTTVILVDSSTHIVYASTTGHKMMASNCKFVFTVSSPLYCAMRVHNMSQAIQEAFALLLVEPDGTFLKASLDGEDHFLRKGHVLENIEVMWLRPTSVVEEKVQEALVLLIVFTCLVLCFDVIISTLEFVFVALPLKRISSAITLVGTMETSEAAGRIERYEGACVMVREMRVLTGGLRTTVGRLDQYKAFMPEAILEQGGKSVEADPPEGTLALVFTDIVRSTDLWEEVPEAMAIALDLHNKQFRRCIAKHNGYEVKTIGDAFMVAFQDPVDAVLFGTEAQYGLIHEEWPEELLQFPQTKRMTAKNELMYCGLRVRMGLHYGAADREQNALTERYDYRGPAVNKAARIEAQALPGMVCLSEEFAIALKQGKATAQVKTSVLGKRTLKGIGELTLHYALTERLQHRALCYDQLMKENQASAKPRLSIRRMTNARDTVSEAGTGAGVAGRDNLDFERRLWKSECCFAMARMDRVAETAVRSKGEESARLLHLLNQTFQTLMDYANMTEGKLEWFNGSTLAVSWNCASKCMSYVLQGLRFCGLVEKRRVAVNIGLACGTLHHGFTGSSTRKYHTVVGTGVNYAAVLSEKCVYYGSHSLFVKSGGVGTRFGHCTVPVDVWEGENGFEPYVVVERVLAGECMELRQTWEDQLDEDEARKESLPCRLRTVLLQSATSGTIDGMKNLMGTATSEENRTVLSSLSYLLGKPQLVTPATDCPLLPSTVRAPPFHES